MREDDVINAEDVAKGRVYLGLHYKEHIHAVNQAFYDGFLLACCESKEDFDSITPEDRIAALVVATERLQTFLAPAPVAEAAK